MKQVKKDVQAVLKGLKTLTQKAEKLGKKLDKLEKATVQKKAKPKVARKPRAKAKAAAAKPRRAKAAAAKPRRAKAAAKPAQPRPRRSTQSAADSVYDIVSNAKNGVTTAQIKEKTGFNNQKIRDNIYKLRKRGLIKSEQKGTYVKA
jgi:predicted transcriptional regulator